ncbi:MAG: hypothetical protein LC649_09230 [Bacteroidales bacterium]|nr:hypothetical protein [Bacteroidales bacterium]
MKRMKKGVIGIFVTFVMVALAAGLFTGCDKEEGVDYTFVLPSEYASAFSEDGLPSEYTTLPAGKTVRFYMLTQQNFESFNESASGIFDPDITFTATTKAGGTEVDYKFSEEYIGQIIFPFVLVILDDAMSSSDLFGLTNREMFDISDAEGKLGIGFINFRGEPMPMTILLDGGSVELFVADSYPFFANLR